MNSIAERLWSTDDIDRLFGVHVRTTTPWPKAGRLKHAPLFDREAVATLLSCPVALQEVDPRILHASQPWILREHVSYYRTGQWERTGRTSADRHVELNQYPVVIEDRHGRRVIIAGHHRAAAALLAGRPLMVRVPANRPRCAVTPLLSLDPAASAIDVVDVLLSINRGEVAHVTTLEQAGEVLEQLGLDQAAIRWRLARTRSLRPSLGCPT